MSARGKGTCCYLLNLAPRCLSRMDVGSQTPCPFPSSPVWRMMGVVIVIARTDVPLCCVPEVANLSLKHDACYLRRATQGHICPGSDGDHSHPPQDKGSWERARGSTSHICTCKA